MTTVAAPVGRRRQASMSACGAFETVRLPMNPRRSGAGLRGGRIRNRAVSMPLDETMTRAGSRPVADVTGRRDDLRDFAENGVHVRGACVRLRAPHLLAGDSAGDQPGRLANRFCRAIGDDLLDSVHGASGKRAGAAHARLRGEAREAGARVVAAAQVTIEQLAAMTEHPV